MFAADLSFLIKMMLIRFKTLEFARNENDLYYEDQNAQIFQKCVVTNLPYYLEKQDKTPYLDTLIK